MNEQELMEMIRKILVDMEPGDSEAGAAAAPAPAAEESVAHEASEGEDSPAACCEVSDKTPIEDGEIPDITEIDLRKWLLVPNPHDREGYLKMKSFTPARLGVWRAGTRYMTQTMLRFRADHAAAQDSVFSDVDPEFVKEMGFVPVQTTCKSKDEYLTRPDHGRKFDEENAKIIKEHVEPGAKVVIVVGDGLSSAAIEANCRDIIPAIRQGLKRYNLDFGDVIFVKYARVACEDHIGDITGAEVVCMLVGERPGLVTAESMSAYVAYKPYVGMPEANRTVISNIHRQGTPAVEAGAYIADLINKMLEKKKSGIALKEAS